MNGKNKPSTAVVAVHDDASQLKWFSSLLEKEGIQSHTFHNTGDALAFMTEHGAPDLVIVGSHLSHPDGRNLCSLLRSPEYAALNATPILVVSAISSEEDVSHIPGELGADAFLSAPVDDREFIATVKALLRVEDLLNRRTRVMLAQQQYLQGVMRAAPVGIGAVINRVFVEVNDRFCAMLGYERDELIGQNARMVYPSDADYAFVGQEKYRQIRESEDAVGSVETRMMRKDGTVIDVLLTSAAIDQHNRAKGATFTVLDITERKQVINALRVNAERLSLALQAGRVGIWEFWPFEDKVFYNDTWYTILGYKPHEMPATYDTWRDLLHPDDVARSEAYVQESINAGSDFDLQFRMKTKQNTWRWIQAYGYTTERNADGSTKHITGTHTDITERKEAEIALRESEERFRGIYETSPVGIVLVNVETQQFLDANDGFQRIVGYTLDELLSLTVKDITHPEDWEQELAYNRNYTAGKVEQYGLEKRFVHKNGDVRWVIVAADLLRHEPEPHVIACGTVVDITERKAAEEERETLQKLLIQAQKMESIGRLAGGVAHDFNNMLSVIIGQADLAMSQVDENSQLHSDLEEIELAAKRSAALTQQLLAFARKQTVQPRTINLNETVSAMLKMLRRLIGEDIDLIWNPGANLCPVRIDPSQMDQILANLVVNARDAITGPGKVVIETTGAVLDETTCEAFPELSPGEYARITVRDTGHGMEAHALEHIFEPFFTTKDVGSGTGLGLATVYGAVKQNAGHITVESAPDAGAVFTIYFPRAEQDAPHTPPNPAAKHEGQGETVLLVEDEQAVRHLTQRALERYGFVVMAAASAKEALAIAEKHDGPIHLLLTDVVMPNMNGPTLYKHICACHAETNVLYMSGYPGDILADHGVGNNTTDFLQKPFSIKVLIEKVRGQISGQ